MRKQFVCTSCGYVGRPKKITKGSFLMELVLWLCFLIPGLIYSMWRLITRTNGCPKCKGLNMIPSDSPIGKKLMVEHHSDQLISTNESSQESNSKAYNLVTALSSHLEWFADHKILTIILALLLLSFTAAIFSSDKPDDANKNTANTTATEVQEPSPLEVTKTSVTEDSIGTPVANVTVKNVSKKTIDAYEVVIKTFNSFGEPSNGSLRDNAFVGTSDEHLATGIITTNSWKLYSYQTATKIEASIHRVHFTDGTIWEN